MFLSVRNNFTFNWRNCSLTNVPVPTCCVYFLDLNSSCTYGEYGIFQSHLLSKRSNKRDFEELLYLTKMFNVCEGIRETPWPAFRSFGEMLQD